MLKKKEKMTNLNRKKCRFSNEKNEQKQSINSQNQFNALPLFKPYSDALISYLMFCNVDHQFSLHKLFQDVLRGKVN